MNEKRFAFILTITGLIAGIVVAVLLSRIVPVKTLNSKEKMRVISLAPNLTQSMIYLDAHDKLVAVSDFCNIFNQVKHLPSAGNNANVKYEKILSLKPNVILFQGKNNALKKFCKNHGIKFAGFNMDSVQTVKKGIIRLGKKLNIEKRAKKLVNKIQDVIGKIKNQTQVKKRKKILLILNRRNHSLSGIFTTGKNAFLSEIIKIAGGINVFNDMQINYTGVSIEAVVKRNPDIIIELSVKGKMNEATRKKMRKHWDAYPFINAIKNNKVYFLNQKYILIPGPGIMQTIRLFYKIIREDYVNE